MAQAAIGSSSGLRALAVVGLLPIFMAGCAGEPLRLAPRTPPARDLPRVAMPATPPAAGQGRVVLEATVLGGAGAGLEEERRLNAIQEKLGDCDGQVRYEAVKAYARRNAQTRGCVPLTELITDRDTHVALAVIDALGDLCKGDDDVTTRILAEAVTPVGLTWHRGAHAFVALAKRAPDRIWVASRLYTYNV